VIGPLGYVLWILTGLLQAAVVVLALRAKCFLRYFPLNAYMLLAVLTSIVRYSVLDHYGLTSNQYRYTYFYSDFLLTICLYVALMWLFHQVFSEMGAGAYIRLGAVAILLLTALFSYLMVRQSPRAMTGRFIVDLSQKLYFVGAVLTYLLWGAMLKLHKTQTRLIHIVLALGVYFSALAANFALAHVSLHYWVYNTLDWATDLWLPAAWAYAFLRFSSQSQLSPSDIAAGHA
jgi:hypothetical protein